MWDLVTREVEGGGTATWRERFEGDGPDIGPVGSGVAFNVIRDDWTLADDGVWERVIYEWELAI